MPRRPPTARAIAIREFFTALRSGRSVDVLEERLATLEREVGALREELAALRRAFHEFKGQF